MIPPRIDKFEIVRKLGEGAMGEVFQARDSIIGRDVALKTIHASAASATEARDRFFREAQAAGRLNHPNLVTVHEFGEDGGVLFLAMELVPGDDLAALLKGGTLAPSQVLEVLAQICDGLGHAHQQGVLHRDIKPSNVRITQISGRLTAKVMDFGIARIAGSDMTGTGMMLGTFGYMAPEYIQTGKPDPRSDLFAVGVILYEALAGFKPFEGDTSATVLYRVLHEQPKPLEASRFQGISPEVQNILDRALAKDPARRFPTAELMAKALRAARNPEWRLGPEALSPTVSVAPQPRDFAPTLVAVRPRRRVLPWLAAGLLLAASGVWVWRHAGTGLHSSVPATAGPPKPVPVAPAPAPPVEPPKPAPIPPPAAGKPAPRKAAPVVRPAVIPPKAEIGTLDEAAAALDKDPQASLTYLNAHLKEDPTSERAQALRIVALYDLERYDACTKAIKAALRMGFRIRPMMARFSHFKAMMDTERREHHLSIRTPEGAKAEAEPAQ